MAGSIIYIGNLFQDMISKLSALATKLDTQITNLQTINTTIGQNVSQLAVKAGTAFEKVFKATDTTNNGSGTYVEIGRGKVLANGQMTLEGNIKVSNASGTAKLCYSVDGGSTKSDVGTSTTSTTYVLKTATINIAVNQDLIVYIYNGNPSYTSTALGGSVKAKYDQVNIVVEGCIV